MINLETLHLIHYEQRQNFVVSTTVKAYKQLIGHCRNTDGEKFDYVELTTLMETNKINNYILRALRKPKSLSLLSIM